MTVFSFHSSIFPIFTFFLHRTNCHNHYHPSLSSSSHSQLARMGRRAVVLTPVIKSEQVFTLSFEYKGSLIEIISKAARVFYTILNIIFLLYAST